MSDLDVKKMLDYNSKKDYRIDFVVVEQKPVKPEVKKVVQPIVETPVEVPAEVVIEPMPEQPATQITASPLTNPM
jgi:hypothetical protein